MSLKESGDPPPGHVGGGPPSTAAARMREAISAILHGTGTREQLEQAARALVAELRQREPLPEQMLLRIKEILADAGLRPSYAARGTTDSAPGLRNEAEVYRDVIAWSIRFYYSDRDRDSQEPQGATS